MATPTTLVDLALQEQMAYAALRDIAAADVAARQVKLDDARRGLADNTAGFADLERQLAAQRVLLAAAATPADGAAILEGITGLLVQQRQKQALLLDLQQAAAWAEAARDAAQAALNRATAAVADADAALKAAQADDGRRDAWVAATAVLPLKKTKADAAAALAGATYLAAKKRVKDDLPADMVAAARSRYKLEADRAARAESAVAAAETLLADALEKHGGDDGLIRRRRMELERADRALRECVERARERLDRAVALLTDVKNAPLVSDAEKARLADPAVATGGDKGAKAEVDRDTELAKLDGKKAALEDVVVTKLSPDPTVDPATVAEIGTAQGEVAAAQGTADTARDVYTLHRDDFGAWSAAVPDAAWTRVLAFLDAESILTELSGTDPAALATAARDAEKALAKALLAGAAGARTLAYLQDAVDLRRRRLDEARSARPARAFSAVRGDN